MEVVQTSWTNAVFAGTYTDARSQLQEFNQYKSGTKRSWVLERTDLSALLGNIQTKLKTYHLKEWLPRKGLRQKDLDEFWILHASKEADRARSINNEIRKVKEELRKRFANLANEFEKKLLKINTEISKLSGDLENQRSKVKSLQESLDPIGKSLQEILDVERECDEAKVEENDYTIFTCDDLKFELELLTTSVAKKIAFIENQVSSESEEKRFKDVLLLLLYAS